MKRQVQVPLQRLDSAGERSEFVTLDDAEPFLGAVPIACYAHGAEASPLPKRESLWVRVAIFGGTSGVGRWLLAIARENGDHVKVLVRNRGKLPEDLGAIGVVDGSVFDREAVAATIGGCDVVLSALGADGLGATDVYSRGTANTLTAMREAGSTRLVVVSSVGVENDPNLGFLAQRIIMGVLLRNVLADMRSMERQVESSDLVYTIVRPARLTNGQRTGLYRGNDRFLPEQGRTISRADVADFMYRIIVDERTLRKTMALAY